MMVSENKPKRAFEQKAEGKQELCKLDLGLQAVWIAELGIWQWHFSTVVADQAQSPSVVVPQAIFISRWTHLQLVLSKL